MYKAVEWLMEGHPWNRYRTRLDLLDQPEDHSDVAVDRRAMLDHPQVKTMISELAGWPGHSLKRHNDAAHMIHRLVFLADLGIRVSDPGMDRVVELISAHRSPEGAFKILANVPRSFGGSGEDEWVWMLCDTPSVLYSLLKMKAAIPRLDDAVRHLAGFGRPNGWPCAVSPEMRRFRGPGRKDDPCPYATLISLKALALVPEERDGDACRNGVETILQLWEQRKERKPFLFAMGTDFSKLKAPFIWYDVLHVLDVLTQFPAFRDDPRLREMLDIVVAKAGPDLRFTAESVWKAWADWDFGQKKSPSQWITLLAHRILKCAGISA